MMKPFFPLPGTMPFVSDGETMSWKAKEHKCLIVYSGVRNNDEA